MSARLDGAKMRTSSPRARSWPARCLTWSVTPPGEAKSYGETSPTFMAASSGAFPDAVWEMPLLGMGLDESFDPPKHLLGRPNLVRLRVLGLFHHHERRGLRKVAVVR